MADAWLASFDMQMGQNFYGFTYTYMAVDFFSVKNTKS